MSSTNDQTIRPDHYGEDKGEQHWDMMWRLYREAWFIGNVTKYLFRYRKKDGLKDLRKSLTYLLKLIELEEKENPPDVYDALLEARLSKLKEQVRCAPVTQDGHGFGHADVGGEG